MFPAVSFRLEVVDECASTQELLLERRGTPGFHGAAVLGLRQTAGYGRRGRGWSTLEGNLALSLGLETSERELPLVTFACGLALYRAVASFLPPGAALRLKWPNDLYLDGRKLAGLIAQGRQVQGRGSEVVVGVGVNLKEAPEGLSTPAVALSAFGAAPAPDEFARIFLNLLESVFREAADFGWLREAWESAARLHEGDLYVVGEKESVKAQALLATGELLVQGAGGQTRKLASEEVSLRFEPIDPSL